MEVVFFEKSGLNQYCKDTLNEEWFILNENIEQSEQIKEEDLLTDSITFVTAGMMNNNPLLVSFLLLYVVGLFFIFSNMYHGI